MLSEFGRGKRRLVETTCRAGVCMAGWQEDQRKDDGFKDYTIFLSPVVYGDQGLGKQPFRRSTVSSHRSWEMEELVSEIFYEDWPLLSHPKRKHVTWGGEENALHCTSYYHSPLQHPHCYCTDGVGGRKLPEFMYVLLCSDSCPLEKEETEVLAFQHS